MPLNKTITILVLLFATASVMPMQAYSETIPSWIKIIAKMWIDDMISDEEYVRTLQFMIDSGLLKVQKSGELDLNANAGKETQPVKPKTEVTGGKLFSLLPQKEDLGPEWKITKSGDFNKATKSFYYENAGQVNYDKNVNTIKEYRMNLFQFSDSKSAQEAYEKKYSLLKKEVGYWSPWNKDGVRLDEPEFQLKYPERLLMDSQNCVAVIKSIENGKYDWQYGYCLVNNYIIYQDVKGYYPDMKDDFVRMMSIAKSKFS